jgi:hypothetical protein
MRQPEHEHGANRQGQGPSVGQLWAVPAITAMAAIVP